MKKILTSNGKPLVKDGKVFLSDGGGGATITTKGGWQGTAVPNSGYVENVYFNTNLSENDINELCSNITLNLDGAIECILLTTDANVGIEIVDLELMGFGVGYAITGADFSYFYYISTKNEGNSEVPFIGWNPEFTGVVEVNSEVISTALGDGVTPIGSQNNLLSTLFSTTPFVQASGESIGLSGEYDGSSIEVSESVDMKALLENKKLPLLINVKGGSSESNNRPVMPSGYIENVYFNTALSNEEVINILKNANLTYNDYWASEIVGVDTYHLIMVGEISPKDTSNTTLNQNITNGLFLLYIPQINVYIIANGNLSPIYSSQAVEGFTTFEGWKKDFSGVISMNNKAISIYFTANGGTYYIGAENDKLTQLFSITPFN